MATLDHPDRERRRTKSKKEASWARALMKPATFKVMVQVGKLIFALLRLAIKVHQLFRE